MGNEQGVSLPCPLLIMTTTLYQVEVIIQPGGRQNRRIQNIGSLRGSKVTDVAGGCWEQDTMGVMGPDQAALCTELRLGAWQHGLKNATDLMGVA
jgi:hypothetical protein